MTSPGTLRKVLTLVTTVVLIPLFLLWAASNVLVVSGTKTFTFVGAKTPPGGTTTTKTTTKTTTTATTAAAGAATGTGGQRGTRIPDSTGARTTRRRHRSGRS
jgi:hypothetical protein